MKTLMPVALGATCLGLNVYNNCQVDSFVICGSTCLASRRVPFSRDARGFHKRSATPGGIARCLGGAVGDQERPPQGFGQRPESGKAPKKKAKGKKAAGEKIDAAEAEQKGTGQRQLYMQFTCNQCEGVSQYMINKNAYEDGIVICTCQSCQVRHLIADNLKKMDFPHFGNNIEEYMESTGSPNEVIKGRAPDLTPEVLEKFDVSMGADGVLNLSPKADAESS